MSQLGDDRCADIAMNCSQEQGDDGVLGCADVGPSPSQVRSITVVRKIHMP